MLPFTDTARRAWPIEASLLALALGSACVEQGELSGPPYDVLVLDRVEGGSSFALQRRQLQTVDDFERLSAPTFRMLQGGTAFARTNGEGELQLTSMRGAQVPRLRYVVEGGAAAPRDYSTLLMFSAAYQFERVLAGLSSVVDPDTRAALAAHGALEVVFEPALKVVDESGVEISVRKRTNAFFSPNSWQFGLAGSSESERAPLSADARVLGHELGHSVFQQAFFGRTRAACVAAAASEHQADAHFDGRWDYELAISGLNEGFADWISFAVTGGTDPLAVISIPEDPGLDQPVNERILTEDTFRWPQIVKLDETGNETRCQGQYCIGTLFARALVASYLDAGHDAGDPVARQEFSRSVVTALQGALAALGEIELPPPDPLVARCRSRGDVSLEFDPPVIGAFLQAFLHGIPGETRPALCRELIERFDAGFPTEYRRECEP